MQWQRVNIAANALGRDLLTDLLGEMGYGVEIIEDEAGLERLLQDTASAWDYASPQEIAAASGTPGVCVYLPGETAQTELVRIKEQLDALRSRTQGLELGTLRICVQPVEEEDWANSWKKNYHPIPVGERLLIVPAWEQPGETQRQVVLLEPGAAFGSGQHESTLLCLTLLDGMDVQGARVLDIGCGTAILAVAAAKLGASEGLCIDVDPVAVSAARENIALNGLQDALSAREGDLAHGVEGKYHLVFANIVASVILRLLPDAAGLLEQDGVLITGGIIRERAEEVRSAAQRCGLEAAEQLQMGEWCAFAFRAKKQEQTEK